MPARLRIVCAWCHRLMQMGGLPASHGICAMCEVKATAHLRATGHAYSLNRPMQERRSDEPYHDESGKRGPSRRSGS